MSDLIDNPLVRRIKPWESFDTDNNTWWWMWGLWYHDYVRQEIVLVPIPLNVILRLAYRAHWWLMKGGWQDAHTPEDKQSPDG